MMHCGALKVAASPHAGMSVENTKKLKDLCIQCIMCNLHTIRQAGRYLAPVHKEQMMERLAFHDMLTPQYLPHVTYNLFAPQLRRVNLYKCPQVTDSLLQQFAESRCKLHSLTLHDLPNVTDAGIIAVTYGQDEMVTLTLRKLTSMTSHGLSEVAAPTLCTVDLRGCTNITAEGIKTLVSRNKNIQKLVLVQCAKVDVAVLAYVTQTLNDKLLELDVGELYTMNDACLTSIAQHCSKLKKLNIHGSNRVTHDGVISLVRNCSSLDCLDLSYCSHLAVPPGVQCLLELPTGLRELSLCGVLLDDEELLVQALTRLKQLRSVRLCGVTALNDDTLHQILIELGQQLTMLDLSGSVMSSITDEGLRAVSRYCTNLEILGIRLLKDVTGVTLLPWLRNEQFADNITTLLLGCRRMDAEVLYAAATNCHNLVDLEMSVLMCVDSSLLCTVAENCPRLSHINLKGCRQDCCIPRVHVEHKVPNVHADQVMAKNLDTGEFCRADLFQDGSQ